METKQYVSADSGLVNSKTAIGVCALIAAEVGRVLNNSQWVMPWETEAIEAPVKTPSAGQESGIGSDIKVLFPAELMYDTSAWSRHFTGIRE